MSKIFLITGSSGTGKTTIAQAIANHGDWTECISHTTRPIRDGEIEGTTYYFVSQQEFNEMQSENKFAESVRYSGNRYGITIEEIKRVMSTGKNIFIIVDNDGYKQIKEKYPDSIGIFIHMTKEDCMANMLLRGDSLDDALSRIKLYDDEIKNRGQYDYVVKNVRDKQFETENIIRTIIKQNNNGGQMIFVNTRPLDIGKINIQDTICSSWK